jgi:hypothetical protein
VYVGVFVVRAIAVLFADQASIERLISPAKVASTESCRELLGVDGVQSVEIIDLQIYRSGSFSKAARRMLDATVELLGKVGDLRQACWFNSAKKGIGCAAWGAHY